MLDEEKYQQIAEEEGLPIETVKALAFPIVHGMHRQLTEEQVWEMVRSNVKICKVHIQKVESDQL
jgi:hypothetical protein